jgi:hypothetical protein
LISIVLFYKIYLYYFFNILNKNVGYLVQSWSHYLHYTKLMNCSIVLVFRSIFSSTSMTLWGGSNSSIVYCSALNLSVDESFKEIFFCKKLKTMKLYPLLNVKSFWLEHVSLVWYVIKTCSNSTETVKVYPNRNEQKWGSWWHL